MFYTCKYKYTCFAYFSENSSGFGKSNHNSAFRFLSKIPPRVKLSHSRWRVGQNYASNFKNRAFTATITVLSDINIAPTAGLKITPHAYSTPAASGMAPML